MNRKPVQDFFLFLVGGALFAAGIFLFTNQVMVGSGMRSFGWGRSVDGGFGSTFSSIASFGTGQGFGLLMIPFGVGVALLLADSLRKVGWLLVWGASAAMGAAVLQSLLFSFRTTSLWSLMTMVVMIAGGGGLMFRSLRDYQDHDQEQHRMDLDDSRQKLSELRDELERLKSRMDGH
jgi:membrane protein implicated in regulation of membrane protease activity